jgi:putative ABC transport system permease protein
VHDECIVAGNEFAVRMLAKNPGFTVTAVATLALAIGANTALFSVLDPLLLRKLPVQNPDQLVLVHAAGSLASESIMQFSAYDIYRKSSVFSGVMAYNHMGGFDIVHSGTRSSADGTFVTGTYFPQLGVRPILGRLIAPADDEGPDGSPVTVLSFDYWRRGFDTDENVIGQTLSTCDLSFTIIGIAPAALFRNGARLLAGFLLAHPCVPANSQAQRISRSTGLDCGYVGQNHWSLEARNGG